MRKGFLIYEEVQKYLVIYEEAVSHKWLCTRSLLKFLSYEENLIFFFYQCTASEKKRGNVKNQGKIWNAAWRNQIAGNLKRCPSLTASIQDRYRSMTGTSSRMLCPRFVFHWPLRLFRLQSQQWDRLHNNKTAPRQQTRCTPARSSTVHTQRGPEDWLIYSTGLIDLQYSS